MKKSADMTVSTPLQNNPILNAAIAYSQMLNWSIFPIQYSTKRPITQHGFKDATTDIEQIKEWWSLYPNAGIGAPTGKINNIIVCDIDIRNFGDLSLERLIDENEPFPHTVECLTGGGGNHYYFQYDERVNKSKLDDYPGIDIQGNGKYIILPPSTHGSGNKYHWEESSKPVINTIEKMPEWLIELLIRHTDGGTFKRKPTSEYVKILQGVSKGERNNSMMALIGHLLSRDIHPAESLEIIHAWNNSRVSPPLEEHVINRAFNNILKREAEKR